LPLPDATRLVEVSAALKQLSELFSDPAGPVMVSLEGIGGIGKTALARAFVTQPDVTTDWTAILWISARQAFLAEDGSLMSVPDSATTLEDISSRMAEQLGLTSLTGKPLAELRGWRGCTPLWSTGKPSRSLTIWRQQKSCMRWCLLWLK